MSVANAMSDSIDPDVSVKFTDREVMLITASLNGRIDDRGRELLPIVLREWAATDLREHMSREPHELIICRIERLRSIAQHLDKTVTLLSSLDERGRIALTLALEGKFAVADPQQGIGGAVPFLDFERLRALAAAAREAASFWKRDRGHPRNLAGYLAGC